MHTLGDMVTSLNRSAVYLHGLQARFELPVSEGASYSDAYLALRAPFGLGAPAFAGLSSRA
jgi:hypothetical protein